MYNKSNRQQNLVMLNIAETKFFCNTWSSTILASKHNTCIITTHMSFTYKPKKRKRATTHGFLRRKRTKAGRKTLARRRKTGRKRVSI